MFSTVRQRRKRREDRAVAPEVGAALYLELTAAMLGAGLSLGECLLRLVALQDGRYQSLLLTVVDRLYAGASWSGAWQGLDVPPALVPLQESLGFAVQTGAPSAELLEVLAQRQRRQGYRVAEKSAARLSVKLVVPLGVCSLPAFICLGVIPVLISLIPTMMP